MTLDAGAANYRHARLALDEAEQNRAIAHAAHIATMTKLGRNGRIGNGSETTRKAHHAACTTVAATRAALHTARDELVTAALEHECT